MRWVFTLLIVLLIALAAAPILVEAGKWLRTQFAKLRADYLDEEKSDDEEKGED